MHKLTPAELGQLSWAAASQLVRHVVKRAFREHAVELHNEHEEPDVASAKYRACLLLATPRELPAEVLACLTGDDGRAAPERLDVSACIQLTGWSSTASDGWPRVGARPLGFEYGASGCRYLRVKLQRGKGAAGQVFLFDADGTQLTLQADRYTVAPK